MFFLTNKQISLEIMFLSVSFSDWLAHRDATLRLTIIRNSSLILPSFLEKTSYFLSKIQAFLYIICFFSFLIHIFLIVGLNWANPRQFWKKLWQKNLFKLVHQNQSVFPFVVFTMFNFLQSFNEHQSTLKNLQKYFILEFFNPSIYDVIYI